MYTTELVEKRNKLFRNLFLIGLSIAGIGFGTLALSVTELPGGRQNWSFAVAAFITVPLFLWISSLIAGMALKKGRSWGIFFVLSFLFPFVTWVIVAALSTDQNAIRVPVKACPRCAEDIKIEATLCKRCGTDLS